MGVRFFAEKLLRVPSFKKRGPFGISVLGKRVDEHTRVMRPLKVGELPEFFRLLRSYDRAAEEGEVPLLIAEGESFSVFVDLIDRIVEGGIKDLPDGLLPGIIEAFNALNFPKGKIKKKGSTNPDPDEKEFARMVDTFISQGHLFSEIKEYTLPQMSMFADVMAERLSGKKKIKVDPLTALTKLGIPLKD